MLREIRPVLQRSGEHPRRWFTSEDLDLIVWFDDDGGLSAFELCYDKAERQRVLRWSHDGGREHHAVDSGEDRPGRHKASPLHIPDGTPDLPGLRARFTAQAGALDPALREAILSHL
jgi:hypothetical protein